MGDCKSDDYNEGHDRGEELQDDIVGQISHALGLDLDWVGRDESEQDDFDEGYHDGLNGK